MPSRYRTQNDTLVLRLVFSNRIYPAPKKTKVLRSLNCSVLTDCYKLQPAKQQERKKFKI
jgi:hypothetical protein